MSYLVDARIKLSWKSGIVMREGVNYFGRKGAAFPNRAQAPPWPSPKRRELPDVKANPGLFPPSGEMSVPPELQPSRYGQRGLKPLPSPPPRGGNCQAARRIRDWRLSQKSLPPGLPQLRAAMVRGDSKFIENWSKVEKALGKAIFSKNSCHWLVFWPIWLA